MAGRLTGSRASTEPSGLGPSGFDPGRASALMRATNARADSLVTPQMIEAGNKAFETYRLAVQRPRLWSLVYLAMHDAMAELTDSTEGSGASAQAAPVNK